MEPVSLTFGFVSLAALFETCIDLADYISLANNLGRDYEATYTKFMLVRARLCAWKPYLEALEHAEPRESWSQERILVGRSLTTIKDFLGNAQNLEKRYGLRQRGSNEDMNQMHQTSTSESIFQIEQALNTGIRHRQQTASWGRKLRWAIRDKKAFDILIGELSFHVSELEKLARRTPSHVPTSNPIQRSIQSITSPAAIKLLEDATAEPDLKQWGASTEGHQYIRNQVAEHAKVVFGNVGLPKDTGRNHLYMDNQVHENARVVMGDMAGEHMVGFWT